MLKKIWLCCFALGLIAFAASSVKAESLTLELCREKTIEAAKLLEAEGEAAIEKIKDPTGPFRFAAGQGYIWIHNLDGIMVMHPVTPALNGKNLHAIKDTNGVYLFVRMNEIAQKNGSGWVSYSWPKPGQEDSSPKMSYVQLVNEEYVVGCGMYDVTPADVRARFPDDAISEEIL